MMARTKSIHLALAIAGAAVICGAAAKAQATEAKGEPSVGDNRQPNSIDSYDEIPVAIRTEFTDESATCYIEEARFRFSAGVEIREEDGSRLIFMPCGTSGAYNEPFSLYHGLDEDIHRIAFPDMTDVGPSILMTAYNLVYEPATKTLTSFHRGRGIGDCGSWYKWQIDLTRINHVLVLADQRVKGACDGNDLGGPEHWTAVWPR